MIIECPACTSRYRIREDKLPAAGGNIKCPNCAHIFFVPRESSISQSGSVPVVEGADTTSGRPGPAESAPATAIATNGKRRWKLKNPVGLIYDFQDTDQLRAWLTSRDSFDGFQVSEDGGASWRAVADFAELADVKPSGRSAIGPQSGALRQLSGESRAVSTGPAASGENFPATAEQMRDAAQARLREARASRQPTESGIVKRPDKLFKQLKPAEQTAESQQASRILTVVAIVVLPLVAAIGFHAAGVIDLADLGLLPGGLRAPEYIPPVHRVELDDDDEDDRPQMTVEEAVNVLMRQAAAAQSRGDLATAVENIEQATELDPADLELWCLLEPLYVELGREADAESAESRCHAESAADGSGEGSGVDGAEQAADDGSGVPAAATP